MIISYNDGNNSRKQKKFICINKLGNHGIYLFVSNILGNNNGFVLYGFCRYRENQIKFQKIKFLCIIFSFANLNYNYYKRYNPIQKI